jgi:hypothetical protein
MNPIKPKKRYSPEFKAQASELLALGAAQFFFVKVADDFF